MDRQHGGPRRAIPGLFGNDEVGRAIGRDLGQVRDAEDLVTRREPGERFTHK